VKSLNYSEILSAIASAVVCAVKFVNSFARRQHLFDIAATPIDVHSNLLSYPAPTFLFQFRLKCNRLICLWIIWFDLITSREFRRNLFRYSCEATEIYLARGRRRDGRRGGAEPDGQGKKTYCLRCSIGCGDIKMCHIPAGCGDIIRIYCLLALLRLFFGLIICSSVCFIFKRLTLL